MSKFSLDKLKGNKKILLHAKYDLTELIHYLTKQILNISLFSRCHPGGGKSKPQASEPSFRFHKSGDHAEVSEVPDTESLACSGHVFNLGEKSLSICSLSVCCLDVW